MLGSVAQVHRRARQEGNPIRRATLWADLYLTLNCKRLQIYYFIAELRRMFFLLHKPLTALRDDMRHVCTTGAQFEVHAASLGLNPSNVTPLAESHVHVVSASVHAPGLLFSPMESRARRRRARSTAPYAVATHTCVILRCETAA
jgi:hypothetical protein